NLYLCAAAYQTADGGALVAQAPGGSGPDIEPNEFFVIPTIALRDHNADGVFDRLEPGVDFTMQSIRRVPAGYALNWSAMPGHSYQVSYATSLPGIWTNVPTAPTTAGPLQISLAYTDSP